MNNKKLIKIIWLIALFFVVIAGISFLSSPQQKIVIGSNLILTYQDGGAGVGTSVKNSIDLAIKEINSEGGINGKLLSVNHQDNHASPANAISVLRNHLHRNINIFIGPIWTPEGLALKEIVTENKMIMFSSTIGVAEVNEYSDYIFNTWQHDFILSKNLADYVYDKGHREVVIVGANHVWVYEQTINFTERFEEIGGNVVLLIEPQIDQIDLSVEALKIQNLSNVDAIVYTSSTGIVGARLARRLKEIDDSYIPQYSLILNSEVIDASEGAFDNLEFLTAFTPTEEFVKKYRAEYNEIEQPGSSGAYDAVMMIAEAMKETNSKDPSILKDYLNNISEWNGASGKLISNGRGAFTKDYWVMKVIDGEAIRIS